MNFEINSSETEREKIFAEFANNIASTISECALSYETFSQVFDAGRELAEKEYQQGRADRQAELYPLIDLLVDEDDDYICEEMFFEDYCDKCDCVSPKRECYLQYVEFLKEQNNGL